MIRQAKIRRLCYRNRSPVYSVPGFGNPRCYQRRWQWMDGHASDGCFAWLPHEWNRGAQATLGSYHIYQGGWLALCRD
jgi:hypothetical protein